MAKRPEGSSIVFRNTSEEVEGDGGSRGLGGEGSVRSGEAWASDQQGEGQWEGRSRSLREES